MGGFFGGCGNGCGHGMTNDFDCCTWLLLLMLINTCGCNDCTLLILLLLLCGGNCGGNTGCHN